MVEKVQIKFEFNTIEDRLLLRISEKGGHAACIEYRFWFTRRFVNIFIKAIDKLIEDELAKDVQVPPDSLDVMKRFQHEAALAKADFSTTYAAGADHCKVFGDAPLLVSKLKIKKKTKGKYNLSLLNNNNFGIHLTANNDLLHSLQKMLMDSAENAEWNKPLFKVTQDEHKAIAPSRYIS